MPRWRAVDGAPAGARGRPGAIIYAQLPLDFPYESLRADAGARARLRGELVAWLAANAGPPHYLYEAGVDDILKAPHGAAANARVTFTADAPERLVATAAARLEAGAAKLHQSSGARALRRSEAAPAARLADPGAGRRGAGKLGPGSSAGVAVAFIAAAALGGLVALRALRRRGNGDAPGGGGGGGGAAAPLRWAFPRKKGAAGRLAPGGGAAAAAEAGPGAGGGAGSCGERTDGGVPLPPAGQARLRAGRRAAGGSGGGAGGAPGGPAEAGCHVFTDTGVNTEYRPNFQ
ncbi:MAG: hypothetical protein J3K34DRAFT_518956 [Monoraphidium minutum]|nr:MAG: hypothetical protein J3K34DRAFT_518956 [Monoraphidium minutum]